MAKAPPKPHVLIARNLYALRLRAGMTQEVLAERAEVDLRSLQRIEAGAWNMTADYLSRFQRALGCRWRDLIAGLDALPAAAAEATKVKQPVAVRKQHKNREDKLTSRSSPRQQERAKSANKRKRAR